jgi:hypothetical protein
MGHDSRSGESLTTAVTLAIKERLERQTGAQQAENRMEWLERITPKTAAIMNDGRTTQELFDQLYDPETGQPK